jgi:hypothetical protein
MHLADLFALAGDVAYIMGQNFLLPSEPLSSILLWQFCGSRFGKRWMTPVELTMQLLNNKPGFWKVRYRKLESDHRLC